MKIIALNKGEKNGIIKKEKEMHQNEYYGAFLFNYPFIFYILIII